MNIQLKCGIGSVALRRCKNINICMRAHFGCEDILHVSVQVKKSFHSILALKCVGVFAVTFPLLYGRPCVLVKSFVRAHSLLFPDCIKADCKLTFDLFSARK